MMLKLWFATRLLALSRRLHEWGNRLALVVSTLYGAEDWADENGLPPDDQVFFLLKQSNGMYCFHGIVAENKEAARRQAWRIPGSLLILDSLEEFRAKLLAEANQRMHA